MKQSEEERRRKMREYTAMIRRNNPEEIAEYKRKKEEKKALNKAKYADKDWRNAYHNNRRANFPSEIKRKQEAEAKRLAKQKIKRDKEEAKQKLKRDKEEAEQKKQIDKEAQRILIAKIEKIKYIFRVKSLRLAKRLINYDSSIYQIHHCFGLVSNSFVILKIEDHYKLHKHFGQSNNNCLFNDKNVAIFIMNLPHCLVRNGVIVSNNLQNSGFTGVK